ncbi:hypothetical protein LINGRAPRIM_LOCUS2358 [Linum grandiflorum]
MTKRKKDEGGRGYYSWSAVLENYLIESMVELAKGNHIGNGSFKGGAFKELETLMELKSPECEVLANPHIKSKIKLIKAKFHAYQLCKSQSGWGWDDVKKYPVVDP